MRRLRGGRRRRRRLGQPLNARDAAAALGVSRARPDNGAAEHAVRGKDGAESRVEEPAKRREEERAAPLAPEPLDGVARRGGDDGGLGAGGGLLGGGSGKGRAPRWRRVVAACARVMAHAPAPQQRAAAASRLSEARSGRARSSAQGPPGAPRAAAAEEAPPCERSRKSCHATEGAAAAEKAPPSPISEASA